MDHPPSTPSSPRAAARRALLTTAVALSALTVPVGVVTAVSGGSTPMTAAVHTEGQSPAVRFVSETRDQLGLTGDPVRQQVRASLTGLQGLQQTTLPAPAQPTTTTTVAPTTTTAPPPPPAPAAPAADPADPATWDRLAQCEANGNWAINTGNGYYGGLQFSSSTWRSVGGSGLPHQASREVQIEMGQRLQARAGWGQWPHCSKRLGLR